MAGVRPVRASLATLVIAGSVGVAACGGGGGESTSTERPRSGRSTAEGKAIFIGEGECGGCHALAHAGAKGQVGPDLDEVLKGKSTAFIRESIVKPNAVIAKGYSADVMPSDFEQRLGAAKIDALVSYLSATTAK